MTHGAIATDGGPAAVRRVSTGATAHHWIAAGACSARDLVEGTRLRAATRQRKIHDGNPAQKAP